jgi:drug/metabolite transporter (DMT)-like permease
LLVLLFGNELSVRRGVGIFVVMCGVVMASGLFERVKSGKRAGRGPLLGLCGALFWGVAWTCIAQAVQHIGWQLTAAVELTLSVLCFVPLLPFLEHTEPNLIKNLLPSTKNAVMVTAGVLMMIGFLALSLGIEHVGDLATTAVVISACYPILTVFLAIRKLNETLDPVPLVGAFVGIAGVVILSLG